MNCKGSENRVDVCLVVPPFTYGTFPALGPSLIKACLLREGISCRVDYADMVFNHVLGRDLSQAMNKGAMYDYVGDFVFAEMAGITPPVTLDEVAAYNEKSGSRYRLAEEIKTLEQAMKICREELDRTVDRILAPGPKIVGVSSIFQQRNGALAVLRAVKARRPDVITFMGGAQCFGDAGLRILKTHEYVDYVFFGECDGIIGGVVKDLLNDPAAKLPYGVLRRTDPLPDRAPHRIEPDLNAIPYPDYDDFFSTVSTYVGGTAMSRLQETYGKDAELQIHLEGSRGCWWGEKCPCTFCGLHGNIRTYRSKDPDRFFDEITYITEKYGVRTVLLTDCVIPMDWFNGFMQRLAGLPEKLRIFGEVKSSLTADQIRLCHEAGFNSFQPGIESLSDHVLKLMRKGTTSLKNINFLKHSSKYRIRNYWNILVGFPGETPEDHREQAETVPLIHHMMPPNGASRIIIARDNEYFCHPEKYGFRLRPAWYYRCTCPDDPEYIRDVALNFEITNENTPEDMLKALGTLDEAVIHWIESYNARQGLIRLDMADLGERILIIDTRECRDLRAQLLIGHEAEVYRECREPVTLTVLKKRLSHLSEAEIIYTLKVLENKKLLINKGNSSLALAVEFTMEELKTRDMIDFRLMHGSDFGFRERFENDLRERIESSPEEDPEDVLAVVLTEYAGKLHMCFTGKDFLARNYDELNGIG